MNPETIKTEFKKHGPWITQFIINGKSYGGKYNAFDDIRLTWFFEHFPKVETILELGSFEGGHTPKLASHPTVTHVLGLDGREANITRASFVHELLESRKVRFIQTDLEAIDLTKFGKFDAILCVGVLYHLPEPWKLLRQMANTAPRAYIWTQVTSPKKVNTTVNGYMGRFYKEHGLEDRLSGLSSRSFWPTKDALVKMVKDCGYPNVKEISRDNYPPDYPVPKENFADLVCQK